MNPPGTTSHPCPTCEGTVICHCDGTRPPMVVETFGGGSRDDFDAWLLDDLE